MITGAVWRPGDFELKEGMTLSQLIGEADGLRPDAFLSRGLINRVKPDMSFEQLSFSVENVLNNPAQFDIKLQREDEVIIRGIRDLRDEAVVEIDGAVRESGVFVWLENMTLQDLVLKADGFRDAAELSRIEISRRTNDFTQTGRLIETVILSVDSLLNEHEDLLNFKLQPYDYIYVHRRPDFQAQQFVTVEGEVMYPGIYAISSKNERISDIIVRAGGITAEAYVPGSRITRQLSAIDRLSIDYNFLNDDELEETLGEARQNQEPAMRAEATTRAMLNQEPSIRIGIDLETALRNPSSGENLYVRQGDVIRVPKLAQTVKVTGAVMQEVEVRYVPGANYSYYVNRAGGLNDRALKKRSFVVYANGEVDRNRRFLWMTVSRPEIQPGAEIVVPYRPEGDRLSTQEIISISSMVVSMTTTLLIAITQLRN
jgi:protein involved in polysaccharide export with SLBB domain